jgi:transcriptional regulator with GAF, ATPase, and Fis domain
MQGARRVEGHHLSPNAGNIFEPTPPAGGAAPPRSPPPKPLDSGERARFEEALRQQGGNVSATARALGMHRTQLRRELERHGITVPRSSEPSPGDGGE